MVLLEDPADILYFHKRSARVLPGKGTHEQIRDSSEYRILSQVPRWREALCDSWEHGVSFSLQLASGATQRFFRVQDALKAGGVSREAALEAKFRGCPTLGAILLATGRAELWTRGPRGLPQRDFSLELLREKLRTDGV
jgi:hypothetical protein